LKLSKNLARPTGPGYNRPERGNDPWAPQQQNRPRGDVEPYRNGDVEAYQGSDIEPSRVERGQLAHPLGTEIEPWRGRARKPIPPPRFPLLYRIVLLILIVVIAILAIQLYKVRSQPAAGPVSPSPTTRSQAPAASSSASSGSAGATSSSTASPTQQPSPTASRSQQVSTGGPAPVVTTVHNSVPLTIPPLSFGDAAYIDLMDPGVSTSSSSLPEVDMTLGGDYLWQTSYPIASLGTTAPSYAVCKNVLTVSPMNLSTQTFRQGDGYCLQLPDVNQDHFIVYIRFTMLTPYQVGTYNGTSEIKIQVTLWDSAASG
jgi:hypothetical protein